MGLRAVPREVRGIALLSLCNVRLPRPSIRRERFCFCLTGQFTAAFVSGFLRPARGLETPRSSTGLTGYQGRGPVATWRRLRLCFPSGVRIVPATARQNPRGCLPGSRGLAEVEYTRRQPRKRRRILRAPFAALLRPQSCGP